MISSEMVVADYKLSAQVRVSGTVRSPVITVEPLSLLTEEALRFFVNRANLPLP